MGYPHSQARCSQCWSWAATAALVRARRGVPPGTTTTEVGEPERSRRILLVSDDEAEIRDITATLTESSVARLAVDHERDLPAALRRIRETPYDGVLLDLDLADWPGVEGVRQLTRWVPEIPVVALTAGDDDRLAIEALRSGAEDGVEKGCRDERTLTRAIRYAIERKRTERLVCFMAYHDSLTGLPNRALLDDRLRHALARAERTDRPLAVLFVDLDGFKTVNDSHGHAEGDRLLVRVAARLTEAVRRGDTVARVGGDEFAVLLPEIARVGAGAVAARRIAGVLSGLGVPASVGAAVFPRDGRDPAALLSKADAAMYESKRRRRRRRARPLPPAQRWPA